MKKETEKKTEKTICKIEEINLEKKIKENIKEICSGNNLSIEAIQKIVIENVIKKEIELKIMNVIKKNVFEIKKNEEVDYQGKKKKINLEIKKTKRN